MGTAFATRRVPPALWQRYDLGGPDDNLAAHHTQDLVLAVMKMTRRPKTPRSSSMPFI